MREQDQGVRVTASVFGRTLWVIGAAVPYGFMVYATEVDWMEKLATNGTGTVLAVAGMWAVLLLLFLGAMLWRFPKARLAATGGWLLSLLPAVALFAWGYTATAV